MKRMILPLLLCLAMPMAVHAGPARPAPIEQGPVRMELVDRDLGERPLPRYRHDGQWWSAGERGHRYAVRLRNDSAERVLVVLSVDGVNAISGEDADPGQSGYVLGPWQTTDIAGWRKSNDEVAQFVFSSPHGSYATRTGRPDNLGVIGIAVFNERRPVRRTPPFVERSARPAAVAEAQSASAAPAGDMARPSPPAPAPAQRLGTGHGEREWSSVRDTHFARASQIPTQITELRYDNARNLRARGIAMSASPRGPQAFPQRFVPDPPAR
ncbi:hypothetical protein RZA67_01655 [Stenotrophomonas sp. C3(2023)]|uniref:hypothetical protein n=1 Tax=Stenotrophomonas sp. C3(2023) TaxID=3080277 RepID=UPI00293C8A14|nr:hypothetical protein [Stenotrophomonas sp. C3(2023)]MDV3467443.1 hypothetical protein [Stenotrophomonas sp. C3(2023)]